MICSWWWTTRWWWWWWELVSLVGGDHHDGGVVGDGGDVMSPYSITFSIPPVSPHTCTSYIYDKHLKSLSEQFASMTKHSESLRWLHPFSSQTCIRFKTLRIPWATSTLCLDLVWTSAQKPRTISPVGGPCSWLGMDNADDYSLIFSCLKKRQFNLSR